MPYREGQTATRADGSKLVFQGGQWRDATAPKLTEDQGKASTYAKLMSRGEQNYQQALDNGYKPDSWRNAAAGLAESVDIPFVGKPFAGLGPAIRDDVSDRGHAAELLWRDAQLKAMTGAGQSAQEGVMNAQTYFPGFGASAAAEDMEAARRAAYEAARMRAGAGGAGLPAYPAGGPAAQGQQKRLRFNPQTGRLE